MAELSQANHFVRILTSFFIVQAFLVPGLIAMAWPTTDCMADIGIGPSQGDPWWKDWSRDSDHDRVDDVIETMAASGEGRIDVIVDFASRPALEDTINALGPLGDLAYVDQYLDLVCLDDVDIGNMPTIAALDGVVMVEHASQFHVLLNTSARAVRARGSQTYTNSVWEKLNYNGTGVTIAILDTGVDNIIHNSLDDLDDDLLTNDPKFVAGYDATNLVNTTGDPSDIAVGHGTHVAGIAMGTGGAPDGTYRGMAPKARLVDVKVLTSAGYGSAADILQGITWVRNNRATYNISIMSMSFGTEVTSDGNDAVSRAVNDAVLIDGLVAVVAVGNDGASGGIKAPAAADQAISVGATDDIDTIDRSDDTMASFSTKGPRSDDGDSDLTDELKPTIVAPGVAIMSAKVNTANTYIAYDGTSMAAPHVSGIIALMLEADPTLTPSEIKEILRYSAERRGSAYDTNKDPYYNVYWGWGIADAYGAVKRVVDLKKGCELTGPSKTLSGRETTFLLDAPFLRTRFADKQENVTYRVSVPRAWGRPSDIVISSDGDVTYSTGIGRVNENLLDWSFDAWLIYTGTSNNNDEQMEPTVVFKSVAPVITTDTPYVIRASWSVNGVNGTADTLDVLVSLSTIGKPDFYLTSKDISFAPDNRTPLTPITISALIHNQGSDAGVTNVSFYDGPPQTGIFLGTDTAAVPVDGTDNVSIIRFITGGTHDIWIVVDPKDQIAELDEKNNNASASLYVNGFNAEPTAVLEVSPTMAGIGEKVQFNGTQSSDTDGVVVLYNFTFGDGNWSGWITSSNINHTYQRDGAFNSSLQVQDNGGKRSNNSASTVVTVKAVTKNTRTMYMYSGNQLMFTEPTATQPTTMPLPNGFIEVIPGTGIGYTEQKDVGTWISSAFTRNATVNGFGKFHIWVNNTGNEPVEIDSFNFTVSLNSMVIGHQQVTPNSLGPKELIEITAAFDINETKLIKNDVIKGSIACTIKGSSAILLYGAKGFGSGLDLTFTTYQGIPPLANAGPDQSVNENDTVTFFGTATDEDGTIVKYKWDFESDGTWDYDSVTSGTAGHTYEKAGKYVALFMVEDNDGDAAEDNVTVNVSSVNGPPKIDSFQPTGTDLTFMLGDTVVFSVQASDPDKDELLYTWTLDRSALPSKGPSNSLNTSRMEKGSYDINVKVGDGTTNVDHSWTFMLEKRNGAPTLANITPPTSSSGFIMAQDDFLMFRVDAEDPDGDIITFTWRVNGKVVGDDSNEFVFQATVVYIGSVILSVTATDGELEAKTQWSFSVERFNNDPAIRRMDPEDSSEYIEGESVFFKVLWDDVDGDEVSFNWTSDIDGTLSHDEEFEKDDLSIGTHKITVTVSDPYDGKISKTITVVIKARPVPAKTEENAALPGNLLVLLILGAAVAIGAVYFLRQDQSAKEAEMEQRRRQRARALARARDKKYSKMARSQVKATKRYREEEQTLEGDEEEEDEDQYYEGDGEEDYDDDYEDDGKEGRSRSGPSGGFRM